MNDKSKMQQRLKAKALGFTNAISKLAREERLEHPSEAFGNDYNRLVRMVKESFPDLETLLPPEATISRGEYETLTLERYGELFTFSEQIYQLLSASE